MITSADSPNRIHYYHLRLKTKQLRKEVKRIKQKERFLLGRWIQSYLVQKHSKSIYAAIRRTPFTDNEKETIALKRNCVIDGITIDLRCLAVAWLTDEVINNYLKTLNHPTLFCMSTFLHSKITQGGECDPELGMGFLKNVNINQLSAMLFPVHLNNNHWSLLCADMNSRRLFVLDSLAPQSQRNINVYNNIKCFLVAASKDMWTLVDIGDKVAQQQNLDDCGVYCCIFATILSEAYKIQNWFPKRMSYFQFNNHDVYMMRRQIKLELCKIED